MYPPLNTRETTRIAVAPIGMVVDANSRSVPFAQSTSRTTTTHTVATIKDGPVDEPYPASVSVPSSARLSLPNSTYPPNAEISP